MAGEGYEGLVIDIETAGEFGKLPSSVQDYLVERERRSAQVAEDPQQQVEQSLALNPAAGIIVSIGLWLVESKRGLVLVNNEPVPDRRGAQELDTVNRVYYGSEKDILRVFWEKVIDKAGPGGRAAKAPLITFNGRAFDGPFLMLRSAVCGVSPRRNMVGYRYSFSDHCDLQEVLSFQGALSWQHRYSLDFWCNQFGIASPKGEMDGSQVGQVWQEGSLDKLVQYSLADVVATAALYDHLQPLIESLSG